MGLVLSCKVLGVPTIWITGTCSEKAGIVGDEFCGVTRELWIPLTSGNTVNSTQFSDTESKMKVGRMKSWMT